jgi:hypothetical protein
VLCPFLPVVVLVGIAENTQFRLGGLALLNDVALMTGETSTRGINLKITGRVKRPWAVRACMQAVSACLRGN